jgi:hypothetical protein
MVESLGGVVWIADKVTGDWWTIMFDGLGVHARLGSARFKL